MLYSNTMSSLRHLNALNATSPVRATDEYILFFSTLNQHYLFHSSEYFTVLLLKANQIITYYSVKHVFYSKL